MRSFHLSKYVRHATYRGWPHLEWVYDCSAWVHDCAACESDCNVCAPDALGRIAGQIIGIQLVTRWVLYSLIWKKPKYGEVSPGTNTSGAEVESVTHNENSPTVTADVDGILTSASYDWSRYQVSEGVRQEIAVSEERAELEDDEPPVDIYEDTRPDDEDEEPAGMAPKNPAPFRPVRTFRHINKFTGGRK